MIKNILLLLMFLLILNISLFLNQAFEEVTIIYNSNKSDFLNLLPSLKPKFEIYALRHTKVI
ncbi:hypothetical protein QIA36_05765 (plasmid) [Borreliella yangtzensis]|uniref:hypothetical protein n=1 Tax=Borreliella yangtzensis TaxID=683292 RepID=UPI003BA07335